MISAIISFLGGSAFRMVWGEVSNYLKNKQDHKQEVEMLRLQSALDDKKHQRDVEIMNRSAELGIERIRVGAEVEVDKEDARAFSGAMREAFKPVGVPAVDIANAMVRPMFAYLCWALWALKLHSQAWVMNDFDMQLMAIIIGFFFADRTLKKFNR